MSGDHRLRTAPSKSGAVQLDPSKGPVQPAQITCPRRSFHPPSWPADSDGSWAGIQDPHNEGAGIGFPFQDCDGYASPMRIDVHFPSCYNPAAGLTDHENNMAFPTPVPGGKVDCPPGWIHVPHLFYETYWDTHSLLPRFKHLLGKASPFVFSNGDTTGFSAHADFISGWDEQELQHIIDTCDAGHSGMHTCPGLRLGVNSDSDSCHIECPVDEQIDGKLERLPGNNPLAGWAYGGSDLPSPPPPPRTLSPSPAPSPLPTPGNDDSSSGSEGNQSPAPSPEPAADDFAANAVPIERATKTATMYETVTVWQTETVYQGSAPTQLAQSGQSADLAGFQYVGCYKDQSSRVLSGRVLPDIGAVSNTACVNYCASEGFSIAGTEYGGECFCGNSLSSLEKLDESKCNMACAGDAGQTCGGDWALSLFAKDGVLPSPDSPAKRHMHRHYLHHARIPSHHHRR